MSEEIERMRGLFEIDLDNGHLFWRAPPSNHTRLLGVEAGTARPTHNGKSYWVIKIDGRAHKRSRLIFAFAHGHYPYPCVDHINGDSLDDRIENLREASVLQNAWNHKKRSRRIPLPMGVRLTAAGRFQARISYYGRQYHLGAFNTVDEAVAAYTLKRQEFYREFA